MATEKGRGGQGGSGTAQAGESGSLLQGLHGVAGQLQDVVGQLQGIVEQLVGSQAGAGANGQQQPNEGEQDGGGK